MIAATAAWATVHAQNTIDKRSETESLTAEIQRLKTDVEVLKSHIRRIVQYLQQRDADASASTGPLPARLSIESAPMLGRADAPVTMIEFSDFECPFCERSFVTVLPEIKRDYIDTGKLRYVFLDFPLEKIHPNARRAAEAAHCAGEQGKFWEMHEVLFSNREPARFARFGEHARQLGLDSAAFDSCLSSRRQTARIDRSLRTGLAVGITSTPSFLFARTASSDTVIATTVLVGVQPMETVRKTIDQLLAK